MAVALPLVGRPVEEQALFNPAFLALLVHGTAEGYEAASDAACPLPLLYLAPAVVLHGPTRSALPRTTSARMLNWCQTHPAELFDLAQRTRALRDHVSEACRLALNHGVLRVDGVGVRTASLQRNRRRVFRATEEISGIRERSRFLGHWLAVQPDALTALAMWGLRP